MRRKRLLLFELKKKNWEEKRRRIKLLRKRASKNSVLKISLYGIMKSIIIDSLISIK